jgi:tRNA (guanine-N(7)-)-methyltransferase subunit TRM82
MFKINSSETWEPYSGIDKDLEWFSYEAPMGRAAGGEVGEPGCVIVGDASAGKGEEVMRNLLYGIGNLRKRAGADE